jgi:hypothetical protein
MSSHLMTPIDAYAPTRDQIRSAVATVADHATDPTDARMLCRMLGLIPERKDRP